MKEQLCRERLDAREEAVSHHLVSLKMPRLDNRNDRLWDNSPAINSGTRKEPSNTKRNKS